MIEESAFESVRFRRTLSKAVLSLSDKSLGD